MEGRPWPRMLLQQRVHGVRRGVDPALRGGQNLRQQIAIPPIQGDDTPGEDREK